jgi:hypothetical protein
MGKSALFEKQGDPVQPSGVQQGINGPKFNLASNSRGNLCALVLAQNGCEVELGSNKTEMGQKGKRKENWKNGVTKSGTKVYSRYGKG